MATRWLAWLTAVLLAVAGVSASVVQAGHGGSGGGVVSAAGTATSTVDVPSSSSSTTTLPRASTSTPPSTVARTTTVPKAAAAVLAAIGSTTTLPPTTQPSPPPTTSTTRPPTSTTAAPTTTTSSPTTSTTIPAPATLTIVNNHPSAMVVTVNGRSTEVAAGQQAGPVEVPPATTGSDTVAIRAVTDVNCQTGGVGAFFQTAKGYRLTITAGQAACANFPTPEFSIGPA